MDLTYARGEPKNLRDLGFTEKWLKDRIIEDTSILGLGEVVCIGSEIGQPTGGRIDLILWDQEEDIRYEVEVMLGELDSDHIIRTIEYWDIERMRYRQLEHRAVIIAEEITNRFFNVISLLNRAVPIIAIKLDAIQLDDKVMLNFTKVLDITELNPDVDPSPGETVDRDAWVKDSHPDSMSVVDKMAGLLRDSGVELRVTYNKNHIAFGASGYQFAWFYTRKTKPHCFIILGLPEDCQREWVSRLEELGILAEFRGCGDLKIRLSLKELTAHEIVIRDLLNKCEESARP